MSCPACLQKRYLAGQVDGVLSMAGQPHASFKERVLQPASAPTTARRVCHRQPSGVHDDFSWHMHATALQHASAAPHCQAKLVYGSP